jgi:flavin reductase (DIM6/NTAB) family NADH-FMN oxidoreductase RutF
MTKIVWPAGTLLAPVPPALITSGTIDHPNVMTAAWTGIVCTDPALTYVSIRPERYTHELISKTREFVINVPNLDLAKATDYCGVTSGRKVDKFKACNLTAEASASVAAPQILQAPISLECQVIDIKHFGTHDMFLARITNVKIDDRYLDEKGALHLEKAGLLAYAHGFYYTLGRQLGKFGYSIEKDKTRLKRLKQNRNNAAKG